MNDPKPEEDGTLSRRELLKAAGLAGIGAATASVAEAYSAEEEAAQARRAQQRTMIGVRFDRHDVVRIESSALVCVARRCFANFLPLTT